VYVYSYNAYNMKILSGLSAVARTIKRPKVAILVTLLIIALIAGGVFFFGNNSTDDQGKDPIAYKRGTKLIGDNINASLDKGDYASANDGCITLASATYRIGQDASKAKSILEECIKKMPAAKVNWFTYFNLASMSKILNDKTGELNNLKLAQRAANQPSSGATMSYTEYINKRISQLGG
jgi:hypothetical protein